jgi:4-amino-4-deoxy-L-arabinose transferase-like glycosyltransferase
MSRSDDPRGRRRSAALTAGLAGAFLSLGLGGPLVWTASHGWNATWLTERPSALAASPPTEDGTGRPPDAGPRVVAKTFEPRVAFPNPHRPLARYVQHWDFEAWGVPARLPPLDVRLDALLSVPEGPPRRLAAEARGRTEATLRLDGRPLGDGEAVSPGTHRLSVRWTGSLRGEDAGLALRWQVAPGEPFRRVPGGALRPVWGAMGRVLGAFGVALLFGGVLGWLVYRARVARDPGRRRRRWGTLATVAVIVLGVGLRLVDYEVMPDFRENDDELFATWNGWQLLEDGTTRGWSLWPGYYGGRVAVEPTLYFSPQPKQVITPYFEHPPLLHVLVGAAAHLGGADHWTHARLAHTRLVPIGLAGVTLWLVIAVGRRLFPSGGPAPWLGALLWAVLPMIVLQSRVIKEEALLTPMLLFGLWLFLRWRADESRLVRLAAAGFVLGLSAAAKVTGAILVPALVVLVLSRGAGRWRPAALAGGCGLLGVALLLVYGVAIDPELFFLTTGKQATGRPSHFNLFPRFFDDPLINHNLIGRGWLLFLWTGTLLSAGGPGRRPDPAFLFLPLVYLVGVAFSSGNWTFGWYITPLYPFLCLGAGQMLADLWARPGLLRGFLFVGLGVMYALNFTMTHEFAKLGENWATIRRWVALALLLLMSPYALAEAFPGSVPVRRLVRGAYLLALGLLVALSAYFVVRYDVFYDRYRNYDRDAYYDR